MLRECQRVLKPGGRLGALAITHAEKLSKDDLARASEVGPSLAGSEAPLLDLARSAGFEEVVEHDQTGVFERVCARLVELRIRFERALRAAEGDEMYETDKADTEALLEAIRAGLLRRVLIIGSRQ